MSALQNSFMFKKLHNKVGESVCYGGKMIQWYKVLYTEVGRGTRKGNFVYRDPKAASMKRRDRQKEDVSLFHFIGFTIGLANTGISQHAAFFRKCFREFRV